MDSVHIIHPSELAAFTQEINIKLAKEPSVAALLPLDPPEQLWRAVSSGVLLGQFIHCTTKDAMDVSKCEI